MTLLMEKRSFVPFLSSGKYESGDWVKYKFYLKSHTFFKKKSHTFVYTDNLLHIGAVCCLKFF